MHAQYIHGEHLDTAAHVYERMRDNAQLLCNVLNQGSLATTYTVTSATPCVMQQATKLLGDLLLRQDGEKLWTKTRYESHGDDHQISAMIAIVLGSHACATEWKSIDAGSENTRRLHAANQALVKVAAAWSNPLARPHVTDLRVRLEGTVAGLEAIVQSDARRRDDIIQRSGVFSRQFDMIAPNRHDGLEGQCQREDVESEFPMDGAYMVAELVRRLKAHAIHLVECVQQALASMQPTLCITQQEVCTERAIIKRSDGNGGTGISVKECSVIPASDMSCAEGEEHAMACIVEESLHETESEREDDALDGLQDTNPYMTPLRSLVGEQVMCPEPKHCASANALKEAKAAHTGGMDESHAFELLTGAVRQLLNSCEPKADSNSLLVPSRQQFQQGPERCYCGKKKQATSCNFNVGAFAESLKEYNPALHHHYVKNPTQFSTLRTALQKVLGLDEVEIKRASGCSRESIFSWSLQGDAVADVSQEEADEQRKLQEAQLARERSTGVDVC